MTRKNATPKTRINPTLTPSSVPKTFPWPTEVNHIESVQSPASDRSEPKSTTMATATMISTSLRRLRCGLRSTARSSGDRMRLQPYRSPGITGHAGRQISEQGSRRSGIRHVPEGVPARSGT